MTSKRGSRGCAFAGLRSYEPFGVTQYMHGQGADPKIETYAAGDDSCVNVIAPIGAAIELDGQSSFRRASSRWELPTTPFSAVRSAKSKSTAWNRASHSAS